MRNGKDRSKLRFLFLVVGLAVVWYLGRFFNFDSRSAQGFLGKTHYLYAGAIFVALYCVVTFFLWFSKDAFKLVGAVVFGAALSTLFIWIAEIINAFILFYLARSLGRDFVNKRLKGKLGGLDKKIGRAHLAWLFLFRAAPLIPFRFLDLAAGLTSMPFKKYLLVVVSGSPVRIFWLQYIICAAGAEVFKNPYALSEYLLRNKALFIFSFCYVFLIILVLFKIKTKENA